jgi:uncharacterized membrane protein
MATFSGGVAVLGWVDHDLQWRGNLPEFERRRADLEALYVSVHPLGQRAIGARYLVDFIVVGNLEREIYGPTMDRRFDSTWPVAFRAGSVAAYRTRLSRRPRPSGGEGIVAKCRLRYNGDLPSGSNSAGRVSASQV